MEAAYVDEFDVAPVDMADLPNFRMHMSEEFDDDTVGDDQMDSNSNKYFLPDVVRQFIVYFKRHVDEKNVYEIHSIYENSFNKLTERYYKTTAWPSIEAFSDVVDPDSLFGLLYMELYYRHIYSKLQPTLEDRINSWANYCKFFDAILNLDTPVDLEVPNQWLWDIIDEFIYQFQAFCQYRSKMKNKTEEEVKSLQKSPEVWNVHKVLFYLHELQKKSRIVETLEDKQINDPFASCQFYKMLGYFSLTGLLRLHCLLGDYHLALKVLEPIDLSKKGLFTHVTACHITVYYYVGFAYLMMRRYVDAIKSFCNILVYISRTKQYHTRSYQYDQILKKNEQMYGLLSICVCLCPQRIDENLMSMIKDKYSDKMTRMLRGDETAYEELFSYACPKFITPSAPIYGELPANYNHQEAYRLQLKLFLNEVRQQQQLPVIRSYLKLYTTIDTHKLADFLDTDLPTFRTYLQCLKHKTCNEVWSGGAPLSGTQMSCSDVPFYVDNEMVHIEDQKVEKRYADFFIREINKFEEIICNVQSKAQQA